MIKKPSKTKPTSYYQKKADAYLQELGRKTYNSCMICSGEYSCLHHFVRKSQSTALRYHWENCIPICHRCHSSLHVGQNDIIAGQIVLIKGKEWLDTLLEIKREGIGQNFGKGWYKEKMENLSNLVQ